MNALELADKAEAIKTGEYGYTDGWIDEAATMLRQQQEKLNKYELRNIAQCEMIAILEAQLSEALDAEKDRRFE